jgi:hypothetical protein
VYIYDTNTEYFLSNLQVKSYTEGYVNKTGSNLGSMSGQVEGLTDRMVDVDQNLNYMLGQLSLVVQEFNQVKMLPEGTVWRKIKVGGGFVTLFQ